MLSLQILYPSLCFTFLGTIGSRYEMLGLLYDRLWFGMFHIEWLINGSGLSY